MWLCPICHTGPRRYVALEYSEGVSAISRWLSARHHRVISATPLHPEEAVPALAGKQLGRFRLKAVLRTPFAKIHRLEGTPAEAHEKPKEPGTKRSLASLRDAFS